jgi:predicted membrane-bound spermidine synthase
MGGRWFFGFFLVSGFCGLVYQVVWLRLSMASFGVTSPLVSIVLSVFMAGLALGSVGAAWLARRTRDRPAALPLRLYGIAELLIALSAVIVPIELEWGQRLLGELGNQVAWGSSGYYLASGAWITLALLPFCTCMGATFPLAMATIEKTGARATSRHESGAMPAARSFSYLYLANVLGATAGTALSAFVMIELLGFRGTSLVASACNALLAVTALVLSRAVTTAETTAVRAVDGGAAATPGAAAGMGAAGHSAVARSSARGGAPVQAVLATGQRPLLLLFFTGFMSLGMEVVWTRLFTFYMGTVVYAFAATLTIYLAATYLGSSVYRTWAARTTERGEPQTMRTMRVWLWTALAIAGLLPLVAADPRLPLGSGFLQAGLRVIAGVAPFCALTGFLTPMLVDMWSGGSAVRAGRAYALNVLGCIVGPLVAGFVLLPWISERWALFALAALPGLAGLLLGVGNESAARARATAAAPSWSAIAAVAAGCLLLAVTSQGYESLFPDRQERRDSTATVIATGSGMDKHLLVNGAGITALTPITKMMAHFPLALLGRPPENGLVICFGMGTSFRAMHSWGIPTTAVELVPSVPLLFGYFHRDADQLLASPHGRIVIDDGRRFLERTPERYDVITVDPPPPIEAAGSGLLYSREFYVLVKERLRGGGILQQWWPGGELEIFLSVARALEEEFPHVRAFQSVEGWGYHLIASKHRVQIPPAAVLAARLPPAAVQDLLEWGPVSTAEGQFEAVLKAEAPIEQIFEMARRAPALRDDRPVNEYYLVRRTLASLRAPSADAGEDVP